MGFPLQPPKNLKNNKRRGRGRASGSGKTAGRGHKGQRAHGHVPIAFEGGQTPLIRRLPKARGFKAVTNKTVYVLNLDDINRLYRDGETVSLKTFVQKKKIKISGRSFLKILGRGKLERKVNFDPEILMSGSVRSTTKLRK